MLLLTHRLSLFENDSKKKGYVKIWIFHLFYSNITCTRVSHAPQMEKRCVLYSRKYGRYKYRLREIHSQYEGLTTDRLANSLLFVPISLRWCQYPSIQLQASGGLDWQYYEPSYSRSWLCVGTIFFQLWCSQQRSVQPIYAKSLQFCAY